MKSFLFCYKYTYKNNVNPTVQEDLEYSKQFSENDSEGYDNDVSAPIASSENEYLATNGENLDSDEESERDDD